MLRNLFIFHNKWQLALVIGVLPIAGLAIANTFETFLFEAPSRFGFEPTLGWKLFRDLLSHEKTVLYLHQLPFKIELVKDIFAVLLGSLIGITAISRSQKDSELSRYLNNNPQGKKNLANGSYQGY
ncbi:MAG: hypothetical protein F6K47_19060 [Symploca sp. SIO2E6]|nr:hypothetical protein [Symploca sp. SIO2E6]